MSAQAMAHVFANPTESGSATLVWLALADVANDQNENLLWMSNYGIQRKTGLSESTVRRSLQALTEWGCIDVIEEREGKSTLYRFQFVDLPQLDTRSANTTPPQEAARVAQIARGEECQNDTQTQVLTQENPTGGKSISEQLWDAMLLACKIDGSKITDSGRGALNKAVKELKKVQATPRDVLSRSLSYRVKFPNAACTPSALVKHWAELGPPPLASNVTELYPGQTEPVEYAGAKELTPEERERAQTRIRELSERFRSERT